MLSMFDTPLPIHQEQELPLYHPAMLEVKLRSEVVSTAASASVVGLAAVSGTPLLTRAMAQATSGLHALLAFERAGMIRRVTPLAEDTIASASAFAETAMLGAFSAALAPRRSSEVNVGATIVELFDDADTTRLERELEQDANVESVCRVPVRYLLAKKKAVKRAAGNSSGAGTLPALAPPPATSLWNLNKIRWDQARSLPGFVDADQIQVAVLDTGIDINHPDLQGVIAGYDFTHPQHPTTSSNRDIVGHGTHVAGTIAARINNQVGINGICTCRLHAMKIFDDTPDWHSHAGYFAYFVNPVMYRRALSRCLTLGVDVVNLSIGGRGAPSTQESLLFQSLIQAGTVVVAAMGNDNSSIPSYPAAIAQVIAVGATSINDRRASFSNFGSHICVTAPGVSIWSTLPSYPGNQGYRALPSFPPTPDLNQPLVRDTDYAAWPGTSMAAPHVAAAAALLRAKSGALNANAVRQRLELTADKVSWMQGQPFTHEYGHGRLNLARLLA